MSHVKDTDHDEHSSGESGVEIGKEGFGRSKRACYSLESCDEDDGKRRRKRKRRKRYESDSSSSSSSESSYDVARRRKKKRKKEEKKKRKRRKEEKKKRKEKKHKTRRKREEDSDSDREDSRHAKYSSNSVSTREKVDDRSQLHNKGLEFCQESKTTGQHAAPAIDEAKKKISKHGTNDARRISQAAINREGSVRSRIRSHTIG
mmetsp:Transcript_21601/g.32994  ORF Transcript_21601/g.32994 Transcript_21601/m.32994 type:complete len:204 (-) Transcript_21601:369-980(-)